MSSDFMPRELDSLLASQRASVYGSSKTGSSDNSWMEDYEIHQKGEDMGLDFTDYLQLMVQQLQNQTMDNTTDTSDMLNQLVQMSVVQMMTTVKTSIDTLVDANTLTYAASLVGKTVTVGEYGEDGKLQEVVGTVTGTGTYQGVPVIFVDGEMYALSDIMAVGSRSGQRRGRLCTSSAPGAGTDGRKTDRLFQARHGAGRGEGDRGDPQSSGPADGLCGAGGGQGGDEYPGP